MFSSRPTKKSQRTLDAFISSQRSPISEPAFTSQEIVDRGSVFVANIYHAVTPQEAKQRVEQMKRVVHSSNPATHEMAAWRCMVLRPGCTGLAGPEDFELQSGYKDDGERWGGGKILNAMERLAVLDGVIIVSRWYGGELLGPARFDHIAQCATEVARKFKDQEELLELKTLLESLDDILAALRQDYKKLSTDASTSSQNGISTVETLSGVPIPVVKKPDYRTIDVAKARRLVRVREGSIASVKALIAKLQARETSPSETGEGSEPRSQT